LQTCLMQEFDDYEIVVSDNSTTTATRELVKRMDSPKIKYLRPPRPLAMSDNWDFGVENASGEFITLIGSDDGLLLHALPEIDRILRMLDAKILRWDSACYNWPDLPAQDFATANELLIPTKQTDWYLPIHRRESKLMIQAAANSEIAYSDLPMIYCSAIHRSLIEELRHKTGKIFRSESPDVYSGFAFAHLSGAFYSIDAPMGINGLSGDSNGVASIYLKEKSAVADDFLSLNTRANHVAHEWVPRLPVMPAAVADSFLHAKQSLFAADATFFVDRRKMITNSLRELRAADDDEWQNALRLVRKSVADNRELSKWFEEEFGRKRREEFEFAPHYKLKRYGQTYLHLDAAEFGVTNVLEAAQLCEKILGFKLDGVNAHVKPTGAQA
jgi:glycosyltransferase involved in cell wall biosynthesis